MSEEIPKVETYRTINELIDSIYKTWWEKENNLDIEEKIILPELSNDTIKTILLKKTNGEFGLILGLLVSKKKGGWYKVYPYEPVIQKFPGIVEKYKEIDNHNKKIWEKRYEKNSN